MIPIQTRLVPDGVPNNPNRNMASVAYITIHNTGNYTPGAGAKMHADYQYNGSGRREASWHYTVDATEIWQSFDDRRMCWHAGDGNGPGNASSIGIEICVNDESGFAKACDNAARLAAMLLRKHNLPVEHVVQHNRWNGKDCPAELRSGRWGMTWRHFIEAVQMYAAPPIVTPAEDAPSPWATEAWAWACDDGITDGTRPQTAATREEVVTLLYRAFHK